MAIRLQKGYPIMAGECSSAYATLFLDCAVSPVFVTGSNEAPAEWRHRMSQLTVRTVGATVPQPQQQHHQHHQHQQQHPPANVYRM